MEYQSLKIGGESTCFPLGGYTEDFSGYSGDVSS